MTGTTNLFSGLPQAALPTEQFDTLLDHSNVKIERIISTGHCAPETGWFDQEQDEWVCVLEGDARLEIDGQGETALSRGDWTFIPAHQRHRVTYTRTSPPTVWLAVHVYPARR